MAVVAGAEVGQVTPLAYSSAYVRGVQRGLRMAGHSLLRRFLVFWIVAAIGWGVTFAVTWEVVDRFSRMETGQPVSVVILSKWQSWFRVFPLK